MMCKFDGWKQSKKTESGMESQYKVIQYAKHVCDLNDRLTIGCEYVEHEGNGVYSFNIRAEKMGLWCNVGIYSILLEEINLIGIDKIENTVVNMFYSFVENLES